MFGWLTGGAAKGAVTAVEGIANVVDRFVETEEERKAADALLAKMAMQPSLAQMEINKVEAQHRSIFIAGWRPAVGWVCVVAMAWHFVLSDIVNRFLPYPFQLTGTDELMTVLLGMLGLGGLRTIEKIQGRSK